MNFSTDDLKGIMIGYDRALSQERPQFVYKGNVILTSYAKYVIEYLQQQREAENSIELNAAVELIKNYAKSEHLVIINVEIKGEVTPVLCHNENSELVPLCLGITDEVNKVIIKSRIT